MTDPDQESKRIVSKKQTDGPVLDVQVFVFRVTHLTEARHEEVVAAMIRRRVLLDVRKLHKLNKEKRTFCHRAADLSVSLSLHKHTRLHSQKHTFNWRNKLLQSFQILLPHRLLWNFWEFSCFCLSVWLQHTVKNKYCNVTANLWLITAVNSQKYTVLNV